MNRLFAIVPAAGRSRRMGQPKLLLPWENSTVIARVLHLFRRPEITETLVVIRPDDQALRSAAEQGGATVCQPSVPPPEMRDSVEHALRLIEKTHHPDPDEGWILVPADYPLLDPGVLDALIARWQQGDCLILAPVFQGRRGHPVMFRWKLAAEVLRLPGDVGLNALVKQHADDVVELPLEKPGVLADLDTPEDYARLRGGEISPH